MNAKLNNYAKIVEQSINHFLPEDSNNVLISAMRYSLLLGGKRLRPAFLLEFYNLCGGNDERALPFACALEMIHTYSLIHDDLPCMDNDTLRRGKPCNHIVYGQSTALLAGDSLLTYAFEIMLKDSSNQNALKAAHIIANSAGIYGMCGGQMLDLDNKANTVEEIQKLHDLKTGALFVAAAKAGCVLANATPQKVDAAVSFAKYFGQAFQLTDDILDIIGSENELGKSIGKDAQSDKKTLASFLGIEASQKKVIELVASAKNILLEFDNNKFFIELTDSLITRKN